MAVTLEELEKRLAAVEQQVIYLCHFIAFGVPKETSAERGARLHQEAVASQAEFAAGWAKAMKEMGIEGQPIGAEKLQEMIAACGFKPEDNEFSREIIAMREE